MLSCSWCAGLPTLTLIPHTDTPSFATAAQAFANMHYAKSTAHLDSAADDMGEKMSRAALSAGKGRSLQGSRTSNASSDDLGERISRTSDAAAKTRTTFVTGNVTSDTPSGLGQASPPTQVHADTHRPAQDQASKVHRRDMAAPQALLVSPANVPRQGGNAQLMHSKPASVAKEQQQQAASVASELLVFEDRCCLFPSLQQHACTIV